MNRKTVNPHLHYGFIGLGLIGASIAKSLRRVFAECTITAYNRSESARIMAFKDGVANYVTDKIDDTFKDCDYIFLCTPVEYNCEYLKLLKDIIKPNCIVTDVGSVKTNIHEAVKTLNMEANFIGGHPMAGSEKTGYENATDRLVENAFYPITPTPLTNPDKLNEYKAIVESIGAIPVVMNYAEHDYTVAGISHLPHIIASELVNLVKSSDSEKGFMKLLAAGGFKDITRIASSSPEMWEQICMTNTDNLIKLLDDYINMLNEVKVRLQGKDNSFINNMFAESRQYRNQFSKNTTSSILKSYRLYVDIADEIGTLSNVIRILSDNGINIKNLRIENNRENEDGVLSITFVDNTSLETAAGLFKANGYTVYVR
ncbi:MAG: prephenate dehydrogenase [Lachnospiraceae bacterium]|nr:prephenate dehydrogenase [Lachnospiraceae bacterium]